MVARWRVGFLERLVDKGARQAGIEGRSRTRDKEDLTAGSQNSGLPGPQIAVSARQAERKEA